MKKFKNILIVLILIITVNSCNKDDDDRKSIFGSWNCEHYSDLGDYRKYQASISNSAEFPNYIAISNFHNLGIEHEALVYATQDDNGNLILVDNILINNEAYVSGKGTVADNYSEIKWDYTITRNGVTEEVTATYQ